MIPRSVTAIGRSAFGGCSNLKNITIPNSVTSIGEGAFDECSSLETFAVPNSLTAIDSRVFSGCSNLKNITIPNSATFIGSSAFWNCSSLKNITIPNSVTSIGAYAFSDCISLEEITIPSSVLIVGDEAFSRCLGLKNVVIADGTETISFGGGTREGKYKEAMFWNCPVETVYLGRNISPFVYDLYPPRPPFRGNQSLKTVSIGNLVTTIDDEAFLNCHALTHISLGKSVVTIGQEALACDGLESITSLNPTPPTLHEKKFSSSQYLNMIVYVPQKSLSAYQAADNWKDFWDIRAVETDGIENVKTTSENKPAVIYDLQGHKLSEPQRGINIINGKKLLVK